MCEGKANRPPKEQFLERHSKGGEEQQKNVSSPEMHPFCNC